MNDLFEIISQSLRLDTNLWAGLRDNPEALRFRGAVLIVLLAGLSEGIGQSVVLFLNQVKPVRFIFSLLISAVLFVFTYFFYLISIDFIAQYVFKAQAQTNTFDSLALAYAPLILSFLGMIPYFGRAISAYLNIYHFLALIVATSVAYALPPQQALVSVSVGWLLFIVIKTTIGRPIIRLSRWLRHQVAGTALEKSLHTFEQSLGGDKS